MSASEKETPLKGVWSKVQDFLTHWFVAGAILTFTGFAPDHWVAHILHYVRLDGFLESVSATDFKLLVVAIGIAVITGDIIIRNRRGRKNPPQRTLIEEAPFIDLPAFEEIDSIKDKPSIAVLPFVNISSDQDHEYFADGMTEDIINRLSCEARLLVIARNSTFAYKGQSPDIRVVGKELGVRYVLEGSIRLVNGRLRINVQLVETANGTHVWADNIDRPVTELFDIMNDVTDGLVTALCSNLGLVEAKRTAQQRPEDLQAWALCIQAETVYLLQPGAEALIAAEKLLRRAMEVEPGYGLSWALLAYLTSVRNTCGLSINPAKDTDEALTLANKAMTLAPLDPLVLGYSGVAYIWAGQTIRAIDCLERSLDINPNSGVCRLFYGAALWANGMPEAGIRQIDMFLHLSPKDPNIGFAYHFLSYCFIALNDFQQAEENARKVIKLMPGFAGGYFQLAISLVALGNAAEARRQMQMARQIVPARTRQALEDFWRVVIRQPEQAGTMITLTRQAWEEEDLRRLAAAGRKT